MFLSRFKLYRRLKKGKWYCYIYNLSINGYNRKWVEKEMDHTDTTHLVHIEIYNTTLNYVWDRPKNKKIVYYGKEYYYTFTKKLFYTQSKLISNGF